MNPPIGICTKYVRKRNTRTAATTWGLGAPANTSPPMYPSSTIPRFPGTIGTAVPSRTKANTASTLAQLTVASGTPTNRRAARSTKYNESWLVTSAAASTSPRLRRTRINLDRNRTATSPPVVTGGIRTIRRRRDAPVPIRAPTR